MLKKTMSLLLAICMVLSLLPANLVQAVGTGSSASEGLAYEAITDEKGAVVSYAVSGIGSCTDTELVIPDTYEGLPVTAIANNAFGQCEQLTSVTMPNTIVEIGAWAFEMCRNLQSIYIPASVSSIVLNPFGFCYALKEFTVDNDNNTYGVMDGVLYTKDMKTMIAYPVGKEGTSFQIPEGITTISDNAFEGATELVSITIAETVKEIESGGFHNCWSLETINIPAGVMGIGENTFENCDNLEAITVDANNPNYCAQDGVLYSKDMTTLEWYPAGKHDTSFVVPATVTTLRGPFRNCDNLERVTITSGVAELRSYLFNNCRNITSIQLPATITSMGYCTFECPNLTDIYYAGTKDQWKQIKKDAGWNIISWDGTVGNFTIHYGVSCEQEHTWVDATCTQPKRCAVCGLTEGDALGHSYVNDVCTNCGKMSYSAGLEYMLDGDHYVVTGIGSCTDTDLVIPATYNGLPVTVIGSNAFADCTHLTSVTLPDTITILEEYAFAWCHQLQSVNIPYGVTTIGRSAFVWCGSLAEIIIPTTATSIGDSAFHGCSKVTQIYIPANVDTIGSGVFAFCYDLAQITVDADNASYCDVDGILYTKDMTTLVCYPANKSGDTFTVPSGVTVLDYRAFMYSGLSEIILPQSLVTIGGSAFESCTNLQSITIPAGVVEIGSGCVTGCYDLTEILVEQGNANYCSVNGVLYTADLKTLLAYPVGSPNTSYTVLDGTQILGDRVFNECINLQEVIIPGTVSTIPYAAFENCITLTSVVLHPGVATIDRYAFNNCRNLTTVSIPLSVTSIKRYAFSGCGSLTKILYAGIQEAWNAIAKDGDWDFNTGAYQVVYSALCQNGHEWVNASCTDPKYCLNCGLTEGDALGHNFVDGNCTICGRANYSEGLDYMLDGDHYVVTGIGSCTDTELVIPDTYEGLPVTVIGEYAFESCRHLTSITLPDTITAIGDYAFGWCEAVKSIRIPSDVTTIGNGAFTWCGNLTEIAIPATVTTIGSSVFHGCSQLVGIQVDKGNPYYCSVDGVLYSAQMDVLLSYPAGKQETHFTVPSTVVEIGETAFGNANNLNSIILPEGLITIGYSAFYGCSALTGVTIPSTVVNIGSFAFENCSELTSITIPANVRSIGVAAFDYCTNLTEILVEKDNPYYYSISGVLFTSNGRTLLAYPANKAGTTYEIPAGVETISSYAFFGAHKLQEVFLNAGLKTIGSYAFSQCESLETVVIPNGVRSIDARAFANCTNLRSVTIPVSVTSIGAYMFRNDEMLAEIRYAGTEQMWNAISFGKNWDQNTGKYTIYYSIYCEKGHSWTDATCTSPKRCVNCGLTEGDKQGHNYVDGICTGCGRVDYNGQSVKIYAPYYKTYLTTATTGKNKLAGGSREDAATWTITVDENGYLIFSCNGQYLTTGETGNNLFLSSDMSDCSRWEWMQEGEYGYLRNVGAYYNGNPQYLQYYSGFTAYGFSEKDPYSHMFELILVQGCEAGGHNYVDGVCTGCGRSQYSEGLQYQLVDDHYVVTGIGSCTDTELVIPATYNGLPVTEIANTAFRQCRQLTSVTLPDSITAIGDYAFGWCYNLKSIQMGNGVRTIGYGAFVTCQKLTGITIPASVTQIGQDAFGYCHQLESIVVDAKNEAYASADGVLFTKDMTQLLLYPRNKSDLSYTIPYGVTTIVRDAINNCDMQQLIIPESVTMIETCAILDCYNMVSFVVSEKSEHYCAIDGVLYTKDMSKLISYPACKSDSIFVIPASVEILGYCAFANSNNLKEVVLQEGLREFEYGVFQGCSGITSITIPSTVTTIQTEEFFECGNLQQIIVAAENENYCSVDGVLYTKDMTKLMCYPSGKEGDTFVVPNGVTQITGNAFYACQLIQVQISNGVQRLSSCAFQHCQNLEIVSIPSSVTYMGWGAFYGCSNLKQIVYAGTEVQWQKIDKADGWDDDTGEYTILYSDPCEKGHTWVEATCAAPKHCTVCGVMEGDALAHTFDGDVCTVCGYWNIDGKTVKLQYVGNQRFVSPNPFNYGLSTTVRATAAVWTIRTQENGYVSLCCNGQYMTSTKGGELYLQEKLTEFGLWELIAQDGAYVLRNVGSGSYYLTMNGCFCTTWYNGTDWSGFLFNLVFIDGCEAYGHSWDSADCTQICTCVKCGMERGYGDHSFEKGTCVSCGVTISEGLDYAPMYDEYKNLIAYQVVGKGSCKDTVLVIPSEYKGVPVTSIGESAFMNHSELTKVIIPNGIREIGHSAFENCTSLTSVLIPKSVYSLGAKTFKNCTSLTTLILECEPTTFWTPAPFSYCDKLTEVYIHSELLSAAEVHIVNYILGDTYAQRIYMLETLGSMHPTFVQAFTCTNGGEAVDVNGVGYIMYTKAAHNESVIDHQDATCTENGYTTYHCEDCDYQRMVTIYASGHDFDANYVCRNCSYAPNYLSFDGYEVADLILGEDGAYYTKDGNAVYIAVAAPISNLGGNSLQDYVEAYGDMFFSMTYWKILLRNTNEDGYAQLTKDSIVWILDLITGNPSWGEDESYLPVYLAIQIDRSHKHEYIAVVTAPTCTTDGYTTYTCSCGDTYVDDVIPAGHDWNISMSKVPTKETTGAITSTCNACGESASVELPKINSQDYYYEVVMAASATADGYGCYTWYTTDYGTVRFYEVIRHSVTGDAAQIEIESTTAVVGNTIRLEMVLKNNPGLMGLILRLDYDTSVLTLVDVQRGDLPMDMDASVEYNRLLWSANDQITENGVLCVLEFRIADGAQPGDYPITMNLMQAADADYKTVELHTVSGVIKVINVVYGDVNSDGVVDLIDVLMLRKYLVNIDPETGVSTVEVSAGADVNGDGEIDLIDVLMLRKYLVNIDPVTGESSVVLGPQ